MCQWYNLLDIILLTAPKINILQTPFSMPWPCPIAISTIFSLCFMCGPKMAGDANVPFWLLSSSNIASSVPTPLGLHQRRSQWLQFLSFYFPTSDNILCSHLGYQLFPCLNFPKTCYSQEIRIYSRSSQRQRGGTLVKNACCSLEGSELSSQNPHWATPMPSLDLWGYLHIDAHRHIHTHTHTHN